MTRGKKGNIQKVLDMYKAGSSYDEISEETGLHRKIISQYICRDARSTNPRPPNVCDVCSKETRVRTERFRGKSLCGKCLLEAQSSKCESLQDFDTDVIRYRTESMFLVQSTVPRRSKCGVL